MSEHQERLTAEIRRGPLFEKYPAVVDLNFAIEVALEKVEEWTHAQDPHGWCHDRPLLLTLLAAVLVVDEPAPRAPGAPDE